MIFHTLKMCTSYFFYRFHVFFFIYGVLNLDSFFGQMLRGCLVCVICNSNNFHSLIFNFWIMIVHTLNMCTLFCAHLLNIFLLDLLRGCLVYVIWNSSSFHLFIFKLCMLWLFSHWTCAGLPRSGKKFWKMKNFPGQGKVRELHFQSGKFRKNEKSHGKVREFQNFPKKMLVNWLLEILVSIICKQY